MSRTALIALSLLASATASPALADAKPEISFTVRSQDDDTVRLRIHREEEDDWSGRGDYNWGQRLSMSDLNGISRAAIDRGGPISFSLVRPAGRFDCKGTARDGEAKGDCSFTSNEAFDRLLANRGIEKPTRRQQYGLAISGVDSDVIDAVIKEGMGTPTPNQLVGLGIFKVTPDFVRAMAHIDGMPVRINDLIQFKIFKITPETVKGFGALGYHDLKARDLVQFSIFKVTPEFVRSMADAGYKDVPARDLVQMRMFGVTPEFAKRMAERSGGKPNAQALVKMRITGIRPQDSWRRDWQRNWQRNWRWNDERDN
ncbi:MAG TPA: hypothetical protein VGE65_04030 [Sphingobium sp.]